LRVYANEMHADRQNAQAFDEKRRFEKPREHSKIWKLRNRLYITQPIQILIAEQSLKILFYFRSESFNKNTKAMLQE